MNGRYGFRQRFLADARRENFAYWFLDVRSASTLGFCPQGERDRGVMASPTASLTTSRSPLVVSGKGRKIGVIELDVPAYVFMDSGVRSMDQFGLPTALGPRHRVDDSNSLGNLRGADLAAAVAAADGLRKRLPLVVA